MNNEILSVWLPDANGMVEDIENLVWDCHDGGKRLVVHADILTMALLRDLKEWGVDEVIVEDRQDSLRSMSEVDLRKMAERIHARATYLNELTQAYGYEQENAQFFDTLRVRLEPDMTLDSDVKTDGIELKRDGAYLMVRVLPNVTLEDMNKVIGMFADGVGALAQEEDDEQVFEGLWSLEETWCK